MGHEWQEEAHGEQKRVEGSKFRIRKYFSSFTRCSGNTFLCALSVLANDGHGVMFLLALPCLPR